MLIRFFIENFKSFEERTEFNMLAGNYKRLQNHVLVDTKNDLNLLRIAALYGANGTGKTNFIDALRCFKKIVVVGTKDLNEPIPFFPHRLNKDYLLKPTHFEIDFLYNEVVYSYGVTFNSKLIIDEWLYYIKENGNEIIFERNTNQDTLKSTLTFNSSYYENEEHKLRLKIYAEDLRHNQAFINDGYNKKLPVITDGYKWFYEKLDFIFLGTSFTGLPFALTHYKRFRDIYEKILKITDSEIEKIEVQEIPFDTYFGTEQNKTRSLIEPRLSKEYGIKYKDGKKVNSAYLNDKGEPIMGVLIFFKKDKDSNSILFEFEDESSGIQRLLSLIPGIIYATTESKTIIIDEIESSIHPILIQHFIKLYLSILKDDSDGQIIFTSHEATLLDLDLLRQDEIWFFEKENNLKTHMYSLSDFKPRFDLDIEKGYLEGKFGAIPYLGDIAKLNS